MLINYQKNLEISHGFDRILELVDAPVASIVKSATGGWWIMGKPALDVGGTTAVVCVAQKRLYVDLNTGQISAEDPPHGSAQHTRCGQ